mgnify:CR=1 FL=1
MAEKATTGDPYVLNVQKWLNETYGDDNRFNTVTENGKTGWPTIYALTRALQIELGITVTADNFGNGTINAFNSKYPNGIIQQDNNDNEAKNIYGIIQGALICKGYGIGANTPTCHFYGGTGAAIKSLKEDAGLNDTTSVVTLNIMKALLSMDYFYSYDTSEKTQKIISMQRYLNRNYEAYIGIRPCDGVYSRRTNQALIYAIQAEEKMPLSTANGNCGPSTKRCLPTLLVNGISNGVSYTEQNYSSDDLDRFKILANIALYFNGFGLGNLTSDLSETVIGDFQSIYSIPVTKNIDRTTWLSLLVSCGDTDRQAIACDCATIITENNINVLKDNNYKYIGRYLSGTIDNGQSKALSKEELQLLFSNGIRLFPIHQGAANYISYFTNENATADADSALEYANALKIQFGSIIYFAVDCDATDDQITNYILPYFKALQIRFMSESGGKYRIGVYGTRNLCTRVCNEGFACSSFVSDMSTGFSGNLGFPIPKNWAFDQFTTTTISSGEESIEIDKDGFSGQYQGISQEYSGVETITPNYNIDVGGGRILINMTETSVPVYSNKEPKMPEANPSAPLYEVAGKIIGYIKPRDFYVRYQVSNPNLDNVHKVMFNDGVDVKVGYITEKPNFLFMEAGVEPTEDDAVKAQILDGHEPFTCVQYVPEEDNYIIVPWGSVQYREFYINKPVPYFNSTGVFMGMLEQGDYIRISVGNLSNPGYSRPWTTRINGIKFKQDDNYTNFSGYVSVGLEYASSGSERAWY